MDENLEVDRYATILRRLLATIFIYVGLADDLAEAMCALCVQNGDGPSRAMRALSDALSLSWQVRRQAAKLLFPVEAATRRLIVAMAAALPLPKLRKSEMLRDRPCEAH